MLLIFQQSQQNVKKVRLVSLAVRSFVLACSGIDQILTSGISKVKRNLSHLMGKPTMWFLNRSDINQAVQQQKTARSLKFWI